LHANSIEERFAWPDEHQEECVSLQNGLYYKDYPGGSREARDFGDGPKGQKPTEQEHHEKCNTGPISFLADFPNEKSEESSSENILEEN
jgi:hypothetical protein